MRFPLFLFLCFLLLAGLSVSVRPEQAAEDIQVEGLLGRKAVVAIDGTRRVMSVGETTPKGAKLIDIDTRGAIFLIGGEQQRIPLGSRVTTRFSRQETTHAFIYRDELGMYRTVGRINGFPVKFLLDTGATFVAINAKVAKRVGVNYRLAGTRRTVRTAAGPVPVYHVKLKSVSVGDITLRQVDAFVTDGDNPDIPLLGMSFLGRLKVQQQGTVMVLEDKL